jgi:hypothetical protein
MLARIDKLIRQKLGMDKRKMDEVEIGVLE